MKKAEALILLVNSMTQSERKAFTSSSQRPGSVQEYLALFNIIAGDRSITAGELRGRFQAGSPGTSYENAVKYLYKVILDTLLSLRENHDSNYFLFNRIMKARILYEKSLFEECFSLLHRIIEDARKYENYFAQLLASRLELEYLLALNFPLVDEKALLNKHYRINETLNFIRKVNEQSSLYELLKYRIVNYGNVRSQEQKQNLNDLVVSEMSIVASSNLESFEIKKLHQLFQANYLIGVGDYKSALRSFMELNTLFENNKNLWDNPPIYYLLTQEGVLDSLRSIRNYEGMTYFVTQLKKLKTPSASFNANVACLIFLYELFPRLDRGDFTTALSHLNRYHSDLFSRMNLLGLTRQAELSLYSALICFGNREYSRAHRFLNMIILKGKNFYYLPLYRTIRMVNLMVLNALKDFKLISYETRSLKREIREFGMGYRIEKTMLFFLNKQNLPVTAKKREELWNKVAPELEIIRQDIFEQQVLRIFDFTAWIESRIRRIPLNEIMQAANEQN